MKVSANGRYLVDDDGNPFFYLADTAWTLFYNPTREEADLYLRNRKEKGFTVVMPVVLWGEDMAAQNVYGEAPLADWDPTQPNEAFFAHVDWVVNRAEELGLHVAMLPTWGEFVGPLWWGVEEPPNFNPEGKGPIMFNTENARTYGEYLGQRYQDRPIFWVLGGDRNPVNEDYVAVWRAMAEGLKTGDSGRHLVTYHPCGVYSSSKWFHDESWLDFNMMQTTTRWDLDNYNLILADYNRTPVKPVLDGETRYEDSYEWFSRRPPHGRRITAHQVRKAAYNAMLSGALGHTYGCRDVWFFHVPSDEEPRKDVKTHWRRALDFPGAFHMGHLKKLLLDYPWHKLVPDQEHKVVVHGCGERGTYTPASRSADGGFFLVYVPERMPIWADLSLISGSRATAHRFNPRTGMYTWIADYANLDTSRNARGGLSNPPPSAGSGDPAGTSRDPRNPGVQRFDPPTDDADPDYVLIVETV